MEFAHIYLCLAFLCFAWCGVGLALFHEGPASHSDARWGAGICHKLPGLTLLKRGVGARCLPQFKSLGRLQARLSHFLLFKLFFFFDSCL